MRMVWIPIWCGTTICYYITKVPISLHIHAVSSVPLPAWGWSWVRSSPSATFFRGDWSWNHFYDHFLPMADSSRSVVSYWRKDVHLVLVNSIGRLPRNSVVRLTDCLDMTIVAAWDVKPQIKPTNHQCLCLSLSKYNWVCVCVFGFNVAFNNFSVMSWRCLVATGSSMLTYSAASLKYHVPDTWHDTTPSHIILTLGGSVLALPRKSECQARSS